MSDLISRHETETYVTCPYNKAHSILAKRMQTHLVKCRRQHPKAEMVVCINNAKHIIPKPEEAFHLEHCEDRQNLDRFAYVSEDVNFDKYPVPKVNLQFTESWDDNAETYNPTEYCESHPVLRSVTTLAPAERKNFRNSERRRLRDLQDTYQGTPANNVGMPRQPSQATTGAKRANQIDENDPYKIQALMNQVNSYRDERNQETRQQTSVWGNSSLSSSPPSSSMSNGYDMNNDFPSLSNSVKPKYGGRGRGRK